MKKSKKQIISFNKLFLSITIILVVIAISIISYLVFNRNQYSSPDARKPEVEKETTNEIKVSVCDLTNNFTLYANKTIQIEAIVKFIGENYWSGEGDLFLEDNNCQIRVFGWAPTEVMMCRQRENCDPPETMLSYLDKKVRLNGILEEQEVYINQKWTYVITDVENYVVTDVENVSIIP